MDDDLQECPCPRDGRLERKLFPDVVQTGGAIEIHVNDVPFLVCNRCGAKFVYGETLLVRQAAIHNLELDDDDD